MKGSYDMKCYSIFLIAILLCLCPACTNDEHNTGSKVESSFSDNYIFPPDETELNLALKEAGMNWSIIENRSASSGSLFPNPVAIHTISSTSNLVVSMINMSHYLPPDEKTCSLTFSYKKQTAEDYKRFQQEEWPLIWTLAGKLFQEQETIADIGEQCMSYYNNYLKKGRGVLAWYGKQDNVYCQVRFIWHPMLEQYVIDGIYLDNPLSFNYGMTSMMANYLASKPDLKEPSKVSEINVKLAAEGEYELEIVAGYIEEIKPNYKVLDISLFGSNIPENMDLYQYGYLVDETGRIPVYIAPSPMSEGEFEEELVHMVYVVNVTEPYYLISMSVKDKNVLK